MAWALALLVLVGVILRLLHLDDVPTRSPDEATYLRYAARIDSAGIGETRALFREYESNRDLWNYPPPVRIGHLYLLASLMTLTESQTPAVGVALSCICSILSLIVVGRLGWRFFGAIAALAAVFFLATSMPELAIARRAWQDAAFGLFGLLVLGFTLEIANSGRNRWLWAGFHLFGVWSVLMKQTGLIIYGVAGIWLIGTIWLRERAPGRAMMFTFLTACGTAASILMTAAAGGGFAIAWSAWQHSLEIAPAALSYAASCCEAPWWQFPFTMALINPVLVGLTIVGILSVRRRPNAAGPLATAVLALAVFLSSSHYLQSLRYLSPVNGAMCLLAGHGLSRVVAYAGSAGREERHMFYAFVVSAMLIAATQEYAIFTTVSIRAALQDLGTVQIRQVLGR